ncbi:hypothetical protein BPNPMPFG_001235 [Mesorhizobium sp. AR07]|uniref:hypothetical protein n=1 Tax=Mesorhizobium sp. AR07 TaxID=2865838 RepID=UPI0021606929|nr:hypothetical protein [Mesorhizobium sp. AR07]UVK45678.1 hypothetical protein BPNPMPFG_001235 [Mesorhizobium sp. AR07]
MKRRGRADHLLAWTKSAQWRAICGAQARKNLAAWKAKPRCGALARTTGEPCKNPAKEGHARCRLHGSGTPKGENWHKPVWPARNSRNAPAKLNRKLNDLQRAAAKRQKRVKRMTPDEREAYAQWQRTHKPGSAADREQRRRDIRQSKEWRERMAAPPAAPKDQELQTLLDELKAELTRRQIEQKLGVFG